MINDGIKNKEGGRECSMRKRRNLTDSSDCKKDQIYKVKVNKFQNDDDELDVIDALMI